MIKGILGIGKQLPGTAAAFFSYLVLNPLPTPRKACWAVSCCVRRLPEEKPCAHVPCSPAEWLHVVRSALWPEPS